MQKDLYKDLQLELEASIERISQLESENAKLKEVIVVNDLEDEIEGVELTSIEEKICIDGIKDIAEKVRTHQYDKNDISSFDILYRILRQIRGQSELTNKKNKKVDIKDALKVVNGMKK
jgi:uncharacterized protein (UPF0335 family)